MMRSLDISRQVWAYPADEVAVDSSEAGVLGRGAYGTVRVASWCGMRVAAKQLHALAHAGPGGGGPGGGGASSAEEESLDADEIGLLLKEMGTLASLRHPNLVLFLGVTFDRSSRRPASILTELLPHSLDC